MTTKNATILETFTIVHDKRGDMHFLTIAPAEQCEYKPVTIDITEVQWDALRYNFMTGIHKSGKSEKLAYVK